MVRAAIVSDTFRGAVRLHLVEEGTEVRIQGVRFWTRTNGAPRIQNLLYRLVGIFLLLRHWSEVYRLVHLRASPLFDIILDAYAVYLRLRIISASLLLALASAPVEQLVHFPNRCAFP
jgi:hypothetical protein